MPFDIILFAALAVFVGVKLYNALGRKDYDSPVLKAKNSNVVPFPNNNAAPVVDVPFAEITESYEELEKKHGPELATTIKKIQAIDPSFSEANFLSGAKYAFEIILKAFASGDVNTLRKLLSKDMYNSFVTEIEKRKQSDKIAENTLVSILASNIKSVALDKKNAQIGVEIISEQINLVKDKSGKIVDGSSSHVNKISELWTFARNLASTNPNWELVATGNSK